MERLRLATIFLSLPHIWRAQTYAVHRWSLDDGMKFSHRVSGAILPLTLALKMIEYTVGANFIIGLFLSLSTFSSKLR